jgi:hypothetical protein
MNVGRLLVVTMLAGLTVTGSPVHAEVPDPQVAGPLGYAGVRGRPYAASVVDLPRRGWVEEEFLVSGVATDRGAGVAFVRPGSPVPLPPAPYTTRIVVRRPADAARFNGTVDVEWFNVTSNVDIDLDWHEGYRTMIREGYAYVGVSAQLQGVLTARAWDPVRYVSLLHPGDGYSFDIFSQVVQAIKDPSGVDPMGGLDVQRVIASGHSQGGIYLHSYMQAVRDADVIDGFLLRGDSNRVFGADDLTVPVLHYFSEMEVGNSTSGSPYLADGTHYRMWQVAGAAHNDSWSNDYWLNGQLPRDWALQQPAWDEETSGSYSGGNVNGCSTFPQRYTWAAAFVALDQWLRTDTPPPFMPRIEHTSDGAIARDEHGNALGGVRTPVVDVPIATYLGDSGCFLSGSTEPFDAATLNALYADHDDYVSKMESAAAAAVAAGAMLQPDADDLLRRARAGDVPPA